MLDLFTLYVNIIARQINGKDDKDMQIDLKFYLYQILGVLIIWLGMTFFLDKIDGSGKIIYYVVTSWLLFLFVLAGKKFVADRKEKQAK